MKRQTHIIWQAGSQGPCCSPWQEDKMTAFSPHFYWQKSREITRKQLYWGVCSAHHKEGGKLRLCCWSGTSCFVPMEMEAGAGSEAEQRACPFSLLTRTITGAQYAAPSPGAGSGLCSTRLQHLPTFVLTAGPSWSITDESQRTPSLIWGRICRLWGVKHKEALVLVFPMDLLRSLWLHLKG